MTHYHLCESSCPRGLSGASVIAAERFRSHVALPSVRLFAARAVALALTTVALWPLEGLQRQMESVNLAQYLEAWLIRPALTEGGIRQVFEDVEDDAKRQGLIKEEVRDA